MTADELRQSILQQAMHGRLVPQKENSGYALPYSSNSDYEKLIYNKRICTLTSKVHSANRQTS